MGPTTDRWSSPNDHVDLARLVEFLQGRLSDDESELLEHHLESCESCTRMLDQAHTSVDPLLKGLSVEEMLNEITREPWDAPETERLSEENRYWIGPEIGRGGMGSVHEGRDQRLGRSLAVKVLLKSHQSRREIVARFVREAKISSQLQHPGIPPIYDLGQLSDCRPFFSMKRIHGETFDTLLKRSQTSADDGQRFIEIFERVCQTMAYVHSQRVIHRDLKPSNIMVGVYGEVQVMDWGLAKALVPTPGETQTDTPPETILLLEPGEQDDGGTIAGRVMGTPAYMSPEQAQGQIEHLDERTDVFALGAILCEILTGQPPYLGSDTRTIIGHAICGNLSDCFRRLDTCGAEPDLIELARHALQSDQEERPRDASTLAEGIARHLTSMREQRRRAEAARIEAQTRVNEEVHRRRLYVVLMAMIVLLACGMSVAAFHFHDQRQLQARLAEEKEQQRQLANDEADRALHSEQAMRSNLYVAHMNLVQQAHLDGDVERMQSLLELYVPREGEADLRGFEWYYWSCKSRPYELNIRTGDLHVRSICRLPSQELLVTGGTDGVVRLWDSADGELVRVLDRVEGEITSLTISSNATHAAAVINQREVVIWDFASGRVLRRWKPHRDEVWAAQFSPTVGAILATGGHDMLIHFWNPDQDKPIKTFEGHQGTVMSLQFSSDGRLLAAGSTHPINGYYVQGEVRLWDANDGSVLKKFDRISWNFPDLAFSDDGKWIAAAGREGALLLLGTETGSKQDLTRGQARAHDGATLAVAFGPEGLLASAGKDRVVRIWDPVTGQLKQELRGHAGTVHDLLFEDQGQIVSTAADGTIKRWDLARITRDVTLDEANTHVVTSADGRHVLGARFKQMRLFEAMSGKVKWDRQLSTGETIHFADAERLAVVTGVNFHRIDFLDAETGEPLGQQKLDVPVTLSVSDPDRSRIAVGTRNGELLLFQIETSPPNATMLWQRKPPGGVFHDMAFSTDGTELLIASEDGAVRVLNTATGDVRETYPGHRGAATAVAFNSDQRIIASGGRDRLIRLWDRETGRQILTMEGHANSVVALAFSPCGRTLVSGSDDRTTRLWNVPTGRVVSKFGNFGDYITVNRIVFARDGSYFAASCGTSGGRIWRAFDSPPLIDR